MWPHIYWKALGRTAKLFHVGFGMASLGCGLIIDLLLASRTGGIFLLHRSTLPWNGAPSFRLHIWRGKKHHVHHHNHGQEWIVWSALANQLKLRLVHFGEKWDEKKESSRNQNEL